MNARKRFQELDSLRGVLCAIIVFFQHYDWLITYSTLNFPIGGHLCEILYKRGYYVVETFFVLSGFGMAYGYGDRLRDHKDTSLFSFIWQRMKKLYPLMTLALVLTTVLQFIHMHVAGCWYYVSSVSMYTFLLSLLNMASGWFTVDVNLNMPLWYVSVLMIDYILFYLVCMVSGKQKNVYHILASGLMIWGLFMQITGKSPDLPFIFYNANRGHTSFFTGVLLHEIYQYINNEKVRKKLGNVLLVLVIGLFILVYFTGGIVLEQPQLIWGMILSPAIIYICLTCKLAKQILNVKPLIFLGKMSTSMYIWHFVLYQIVRILSYKISIDQFYSELWFYCVIIVYVIGASYLSNHFLEPKLNGLVARGVENLHCNER